MARKRVRHFRKFTGKKSDGRYYNADTGKYTSESVSNFEITQKPVKNNPEKIRRIASHTVSSPTGQRKVSIPTNQIPEDFAGTTRNVQREMDSSPTSQAITIGFRNNMRNRQKVYYFIRKHQLRWSQKQFFGSDCWLVVDKHGTVLFQSDERELAQAFQSANGGVLRENRKHISPSEDSACSELCNGALDSEFVYITLSTGQDVEKFRLIWEELSKVLTWKQSFIEHLILADNPHSSNSSTAHHFPYRKPKHQSKPPKHRPASAESDLKGRFA